MRRFGDIDTAKRDKEDEREDERDKQDDAKEAERDDKVIEGVVLEVCKDPLLKGLLLGQGEALKVEKVGP